MVGCQASAWIERRRLVSGSSVILVHGVESKRFINQSKEDQEVAAACIWVIYIYIYINIYVHVYNIYIYI